MIEMTQSYYSGKIVDLDLEMLFMEPYIILKINQFNKTGVKFLTYENKPGGVRQRQVLHRLFEYRMMSPTL